MKKTIVLGATPNPDRYAYRAVVRLMQHGHTAIPVGIRKGAVNGVEIQPYGTEIEAVDTITLYLRDEHQEPYYDYIFSLHPKRIIFNPGAENPELARLALAKGIEPVEACTLVLLAIGQY